MTDQHEWAELARRALHAGDYHTAVRAAGEALRADDTSAELWDLIARANAELWSRRQRPTTVRVRRC